MTDTPALVRRKEKKRYLLAPFEDGEPRLLVCLDAAIDDLRDWFADEFTDPGDERRYRIVEMTDDEAEALPEL